MAYTFSQLKTAAEHALGGTPDSRTSLGEIVNRAARYLANAHPWSWRTAFASIAFTAGSASIDLPDDFGELIAVETDQASSFTYVTAADEYEIIRRASETAATRLLYCMSSNSSTGAPALRIAPKPQDALADALIVSYRRVLLPKDDDGTADGTSYPVPEWQQDTLLALCRAFALSTEEQKAGEDWQIALRMLEADRQRDAGGRGQAGTPRGTTAGQYSFRELKAEAQRIMGPIPGTNAARVVNEAIEQFVHAHPWRWRIKTTTLDFTVDQTYIDLPTDFGELTTLIGYGAKYTGCQWADMETILLHRVHGPGGAAMYLLYHVGMADKEDPALGDAGSVRPTRRLEIAPAPTETLADALYLTYQQAIYGFAEDGAADDAKTPDIPVGMHGPLMAFVRAQAAFIAGRPDVALYAAERERQLHLAKTTDIRSGPIDLGRPSGTLIDDYTAEGGWGPGRYIPPFGTLP